MRLAVVVAASLLGGCQLYFGGDDDPCETGGIGYDDGAYPAQELRNPNTGECESFGGGGGGGCDACGNCYDYDEPAIDIAYPSWPQCYSHCDGLDEESCIDTQNCQVAYWERTDYDDAPNVLAFRGCYAAQDGGPMPYDSCGELDAFGCTLHDECALVYSDASQPNWRTPSPYSFVRCTEEPTFSGCDNVDCGMGYHCEESCYPTPGGVQCTPMCVPDQGAGCAEIDCGPGYDCVETCSTEEPTMGGGCFPGECWATCVPTTACETLTTQAACDARGDCTSVFDGQNCTCYPGGYCECEILTWDRCESLGVVPMPL